MSYHCHSRAILQEKKKEKESSSLLPRGTRQMTIYVPIMGFSEKFSSYTTVQFIPFFRMPELLWSSLCFKKSLVIIFLNSSIGKRLSSCASLTQQSQSPTGPGYTRPWYQQKKLYRAALTHKPQHEKQILPQTTENFRALVCNAAELSHFSLKNG